MKRKQSRYGLILSGIALGLIGVALYILSHAHTRNLQLAQPAEAFFSTGQYHQAIAADQHLLERLRAWPSRLSARVFGEPINAATLRLRIANSYYRLTELDIRTYLRSRHDPRLTPRPSLEAIQRALTAVIEAYDQVPQTDSHAYWAAQLNAARTAAWSVWIAALYEATPGGPALSQRAADVIARAERAVDITYDQPRQLDPRDWIAAIQLLESLTTPSRQKSPPATARTRLTFSDLLRQDAPQLSESDRERYQQFFFAKPLEANLPWPARRHSHAGSESQPPSH